MKSKKNPYIISLAIIVVIAAALLLVFGLPKAAAACSSASQCNTGGYLQSPVYAVPQYMYYQDPAKPYKDSMNYTPVIYSIPLYVQTGKNPGGPAYPTYSGTPMSNSGLSYVPNGTTPSSYYTGNYSNPTYSYNQPSYNYGNGYNNGYNSGFTMSGGSQANTVYGASAGGFVNTSGR